MGTAEQEEPIGPDLAFVRVDVRSQKCKHSDDLHATLHSLKPGGRATASVICRLEDADYDGHSLSMLKRIAEALDKRVEIRFPPAKKRTA